MGDSLWRCCVAMVDDLVIASAEADQHVADLTEVFGKLAARGHSIKPTKMKFMAFSKVYIGHWSEGSQLRQP